MLYATLKQLLPYGLLIIFALYGVDGVLSKTGLLAYRDVFIAFIIALIMQPWIVYHLEN